ncbi:hypothetical protein Barb4_02878 [Bacteroidales bacterium Barb4]|nr:hypothetical protein Barb4_02878 [Bacteroidales bacterium Barb4]
MCHRRIALQTKDKQREKRSRIPALGILGVQLCGGVFLLAGYGRPYIKPFVLDGGQSRYLLYRNTQLRPVLNCHKNKIVQPRIVFHIL